MTMLDDAHAPSPPGYVKWTPRDSVKKLARDFNGRLQHIETGRYLWVHKYEKVLAKDWTRDWDHYWKQCQGWRTDVNTSVSALIRDGHVEDGHWLARELLPDQVEDMATFKIEITVGRGREVLEFVPYSFKAATWNEELSQGRYSSGATNNHYHTGADDPSVDNADNGDSLHNNPEFLQFLSLATPLDIEIDPTKFLKTPLLMSQATRQKRWISSTPRIAFCVECPCINASIPTRRFDLSSSAPSHECIPRSFHVDPFQADYARHHFRIVHGMTFSTMEEILYQFGREIQMDDGKTIPERFAIAANNAAVQTWHKQMDKEWEELRQRSKTLPSAAHITNHSVQADTVTTKNSVFIWPGTMEHGVVLCPYLECTLPDFTSNPLEHDRAIRHFMQHGLHLKNNNDVLQLFGFQLIGVRPDAVESSEQNKPAAPAADSIITALTERDDKPEV
ncbi:hypothetical protein NUW58_g32 [Xylaria curta]|uniref:Uncharacterized protein n=1 Tax=Xylaria curta TaxID=42375 RepID=A0ACC1PTF7_9PEZI|nr:hypothetical protein NUW58_g32 [Xylaria curta]